MRLFWLILSLTLIWPLMADELVIIQTVSGSQKTFVIAKGRIDGIYEGQESVFSTNDASIKAKVVQSSRQFSLWRASGAKAKVPFAKKEYVNYSPTVEKVWSDISRISHHIDKEQEKFIRLGTRFPSSWLLRANLTNAISEAVSGSSQAASRTGMQFEMLYSRPLSGRFEWNAGIRYDKESISLNNPALIIPTYRYIGVLEIKYHFPHLKILGYNTYIGLGMGYGQSTTQNGNQISSGNAFVLPFRLGAVIPVFAGYALTLEGVIESMNVKEDFANGYKQNTNLITTKIALGLKF